MPKGFFTQGLAVLLARAPSLDEMSEAIAEPIARRIDEPAGWLSGASLVVGYRPEANGYVTIDVVGEPWPDGMGSPRESPELFAAWSMGHFGPFAYPRSLERARQQAWHLDPPPDRLVARHRAFVRVRCSYAFGAAPDAPVSPADVDPARELERVHVFARRLLGLRGALLLFNPNADMLLTADALDGLLEDARLDERLPIDAWANVRFFVLDGVADGWALMDSVGLRQLDRTDLEACFPRGRDPGEVAGFVKSVALYVATAGDVIRDGDTLDGPGGLWRARHVEESLVEPPRPVVRLTPEGAKLPPRLAGGSRRRAPTT